MMTVTDANADTDVPEAGSRPFRVGIVGGGASGALVTARLLRDSVTPLDIVIFEPRPELAKGVAYETTDSLHLLNVPACNMSALPEDPGHFRRWAGCADTDFAARALYGEYLQSILFAASTEAEAGVTLTHVREAVTDISPTPQPRVKAGDDGWDVDVIVLATGHDEPVLPLFLDGLPVDRVIGNPWLPGGLERITDGQDVLVIGTGLTFVDVALTILNNAPSARVHAVSRSGLLPQAHEDPWRPAYPAPDLPTQDVDPLAVLGYVMSFGDDWRRGIDSLRPITSTLWMGMDDPTRESFVGHLARYWNVHRHRMAPAVSRMFEALVASGRITLHRANVSSVEVAGDRTHAVLSDGTALDVDHVVVCTGPSGDMSRNQLGRTLIARGIAQPGPLGVGYRVDPATGAVISSAGDPEATILTIGPLRRGEVWESIAMPEVRVQAADVANAVLAMARGATTAT
jgi:uncharacterized NAD(P)/FAD-binding protein YdhS